MCICLDCFWTKCTWQAECGMSNTILSAFAIVNQCLTMSCKVHYSNSLYLPNCRIFVCVFGTLHIIKSSFTSMAVKRFLYKKKKSQVHL